MEHVSDSFLRALSPKIEMREFFSISVSWKNFLNSSGLKVSQTVETDANDFKTREDDACASKHFSRASPALGDKECASTEGASEKILSVQYFKENQGPTGIKVQGFTNTGNKT